MNRRLNYQLNPGHHPCRPRQARRAGFFKICHEDVVTVPNEESAKIIAVIEKGRRMMPNYEPVIDKLLEKSEAGTLPWKPTFNEDTFILALEGEATFEVSRLEDGGF